MLVPSKIRGRIEALLINRDRNKTLSSERITSVDVSYSGFAGEAHGGLTRPSCSRVKLQYDPGTRIRNTRQITVLAEEELAQIAVNMGIGHLEPEWIGANLVLSGIPGLTLLPPAGRLIFDSGVSIVVDMENGPCKFAGENIDQHFPGFGERFAKAAQHLRGVTAWVECEGELTPGMEARLHIPVQPPWPHMPELPGT